MCFFSPKAAFRYQRIQREELGPTGKHLSGGIGQRIASPSRRRCTGIAARVPRHRGKTEWDAVVRCCTPILICDGLSYGVLSPPGGGLSPPSSAADDFSTDAHVLRTPLPITATTIATTIAATATTTAVARTATETATARTRTKTTN